MPFRFRFALPVTEATVHLPVTSDGASFLLGAEVPVEDEGLTLRVARHPFPVATELRVVGREQLEAGQSPLAERSEEHTSELQSLTNLVCRLLLEKKKSNK